MNVLINNHADKAGT